MQAAREPLVVNHADETGAARLIWIQHCLEPAVLSRHVVVQVAEERRDLLARDHRDLLDDSFRENESEALKPFPRVAYHQPLHRTQPREELLETSSSGVDRSTFVAGLRPRLEHPLGGLPFRLRTECFGKDGGQSLLREKIPDDPAAALKRAVPLV